MVLFFFFRRHDDTCLPLVMSFHFRLKKVRKRVASVQREQRESVFLFDILYRKASFLRFLFSHVFGAYAQFSVSLSVFPWGAFYFISFLSCFRYWRSKTTV